MVTVEAGHDPVEDVFGGVYIEEVLEVVVVL